MSITKTSVLLKHFNKVFLRFYERREHTNLLLWRINKGYQFKEIRNCNYYKQLNLTYNHHHLLLSPRSVCTLLKTEHLLSMKTKHIFHRFLHLFPFLITVIFKRWYTLKFYIKVFRKMHLFHDAFFYSRTAPRQIRYNFFLNTTNQQYTLMHNFFFLFLPHCNLSHIQTCS